MKGRLISNKSVSQFCEKKYIFQITGGFDDNKDESSTLKVIENTTTLREKSFSQKTLLLEISLSLISGRFRDPNFKFRKTGAHFM